MLIWLIAGIGALLAVTWGCYRLARRLGPDRDIRSQAEHEREAEVLTRGKGPFV